MSLASGLTCPSLPECRAGDPGYRGWATSKVLYSYSRACHRWEAYPVLCVTEKGPAGMASFGLLYQSCHSRKLPAGSC